MSNLQTKDLAFIWIYLWLHSKEIVRTTISIKHLICPFFLHVIVSIIKLIFSQKIVKFFLSIGVSLAAYFGYSFSVFSNISYYSGLVHVGIPAQWLTYLINFVDLCNHLCKIFIKFLSHEDFKFFFMMFSIFLFKDFKCSFFLLFKLLRSFFLFFSKFLGFFLLGFQLSLKLINLVLWRRIFHFHF